MMGSKVGVAIVLAVAAQACGGAEPPPQTGGAGAGAPSASPSNAPAETAAPVAEPPQTPEMQAGIKAFDAGSFADARKAFESAVKKNPNDYQSFSNLGMTCEKLGDKAAAERAYKSALAIKPDLEGTSADLSALYVDQGRIDDALAVARTGLAKHPGSGALHENLGVAMAARGDQDNATKELAQAVQITPSDPMFHLTFAHWLNVWKIRGAAAHLDAARDLVKDDLGMLAAIGLEYRMAGEFESCVKTFDRAVGLKDGGEVRTERALCKLGLKDQKGAMDDLQASVSTEPSYAPGHYYLGGRLAVAKRFKEAVAEFAKYLQLEPNGSLSKPAADKMKAAEDVMTKDKGVKKK